jgi:hypothetical protein
LIGVSVVASARAAPRNVGREVGPRGDHGAGVSVYGRVSGVTAAVQSGRRCGRRRPVDHPDPTAVVVAVTDGGRSWVVVASGTHLL